MDYFCTYARIFAHPCGVIREQVHFPFPLPISPFTEPKKTKELQSFGVGFINS